MEKVIENFIAYMREAKKASQNTEISYERDLKKLCLTVETLHQGIGSMLRLRPYGWASSQSSA